MYIFLSMQKRLHSIYSLPRLSRLKRRVTERRKIIAKFTIPSVDRLYYCSTVVYVIRRP